MSAAKKPGVKTHGALAVTDLYDALTLHIARADALTGLLAERLSALDERPDAPSELYALSIVAASASDQLQRILDSARALHKAAGTR